MYQTGYGLTNQTAFPFLFLLRNTLVARDFMYADEPNNRVQYRSNMLYEFSRQHKVTRTSNKATNFTYAHATQFSAYRTYKMWQKNRIYHQKSKRQAYIVLQFFKRKNRCSRLEFGMTISTNQCYTVRLFLYDCR